MLWQYQEPETNKCRKSRLQKWNQNNLGFLAQPKTHLPVSNRAFYLSFILVKHLLWEQIISDTFSIYFSYPYSVHRYCPALNITCNFWFVFLCFMRFWSTFKNNHRQKKILVVQGVSPPPPLLLVVLPLKNNFCICLFP